MQHAPPYQKLTLNIAVSTPKISRRNMKKVFLERGENTAYPMWKVHGNPSKFKKLQFFEAAKSHPMVQ